MYKPLAVAAGMCALLFLSAAALCAQNPSIFGKQRYYSASFNAGTNLLQKGYPGYENSPSIGADFYIPRSERSTIGTHWWSRYAWRLSFDYSPMIVPEGVYGTTEDLFDLSVSQVYFFPTDSDGASSLFAGVGFGGYIDWIRVDTPATGAVSNTSFFPGASFSLGWGYKLTDALEIVPEIRTHFALIARDYFTVNTSLLLGVAWWFDQ